MTSQDDNDSIAAIHLTSDARRLTPASDLCYFSGSQPR
jgi:hypothetical protein